MKSTWLLVDVLKDMELDKKEILDVGTGTGILSIYCAKHANAKVFATDINKKAVTLAKVNAKLNEVDVTVRHGMLCTPFKGRQFDFILFNPPYFPLSPPSPQEYSLFAGRNYEVLKAFLKQLPHFLHESGVALLTYSSALNFSQLHQYLCKCNLQAEKVGSVRGLPMETIFAFLLSIS